MRLLSAGPPGPSGPKQEMLEESADNLSTSLRLAESAPGIRVLAVTSAVSGEGKSSVAAQLAASLARTQGETVLLIDGDMRSPDVHHLFHVRRDPGLVMVLAGGCQPEEAIVPTSNPRLHVLPAGRLDANPHKLLTTPKLRSILDSLSAKYRYIVLDTPPVLPASEALTLAKAADAVLLCTMRDVSLVHQVEKAQPADGKRGDSGGGSRAQRHTDLALRLPLRKLSGLRINRSRGLSPSSQQEMISGSN